MKKFTLVFLLSYLFVHFSQAQMFNELHSITGGSLKEFRDFHHFDIDDDGDMDILVSKVHYLYYIENKGGAEYEIGKIDKEFCVADKFTIMDVDNDGRKDIVINHYCELSNISYLRNLGNFNFSDTNTITKDLYRLKSIESYDFDGDGFKDIVAGNSTGIVLFTNNQNGGFIDKGVISNHPFRFMHCLDMDNDGDIDILHSSLNNSIVRCSFNNGADEFQDSLLYIGALSNEGFIAFDSDSDNDIDIMVGDLNQGILLLLNDGNFNYDSIISIDSTHWLSIPKAIDYDHDQDIDIVYYSPALGSQFNVLVNQGDNNYVINVLNDVNISSYFSSEVCDFDNNGWEDLIYGNPFYGLFGWFDNYENEHFENEYNLLSDVQSIHGAQIGDFDGDGLKDVFVVNSNTNKIVYLNDGNGGYNDTIEFENDVVGGKFSYDVNNDGFADIILYNGSTLEHLDDTNFCFFKNNHNNTFTKIVEPNFDSYNNRLIYLIDYNGDTKSEIVLVNRFNLDTITILGINNDFSLYLEKTILIDPPVNNYDDFFIMDVDANGIKDFVFTNVLLAQEGIPEILVSYNYVLEDICTVDTLVKTDFGFLDLITYQADENTPPDFLFYDLNYAIYLENDGNNNFDEYYYSFYDLYLIQPYFANIDNDLEPEVFFFPNPESIGLLDNLGEEFLNIETYPHNIFIYNGNSFFDGYFDRKTIDMDSDGDLDLLFAFRYMNGVYWLENDMLLNQDEVLKFNNKFNVYPNPVSANNIEINLGEENLDCAEVFVYNSSGSLVNTLKEINPEKTIDLNISNLAPGAYFVKVKTVNGIKSSKFVVIN